MSGISVNIIARLKRNTSGSVEKICRVMNCKVADFVDDKKLEDK